MTRIGLVASALRHAGGADSWRARRDGPEVTQEITVASHVPQGGRRLRQADAADRASNYTARIRPAVENLVPFGTGRPGASARSPGRRVSREPVWNFYPTKTTCSAVAQCNYGRI
jgi:hypothetical protein